MVLTISESAPMPACCQHRAPFPCGWQLAWLPCVMQVLQIVSECPDTSPLHVMKAQAQHLFTRQPQPDDLPRDIPDLGTLGNYLLTR